MDHWKIAMLGDGSVGKTALAIRATLLTYDPTIEDAYRKQMVIDNKMSFIEVIDTAGQEEYVTLRDQWIREADGVVLVYSIASRRSFARIQDIWQSMKRLRRDEPGFILVGNMSDKADAREVSRQEGATLAFRLGCQFVETSAKTGENVDSVYRDVVRSLRQARTSMPQKSSQAQPAKHTKRAKDRDGRGKDKKSETKCVVM